MDSRIPRHRNEITGILVVWANPRGERPGSVAVAVPDDGQVLLSEGDATQDEAFLVDGLEAWYKAVPPFAYEPGEVALIVAPPYEASKPEPIGDTLVIVARMSEETQACSA